MTPYTFTVPLKNLLSLAEQIAGGLREGDVIALWGDLGAGKTTFSKALIQGLVGKVLDVPSPTFTLVQTYDCPQGEIWHCDLYRLKDPEEALELGLEDAFYSTICLIEWPERLGSFLPHRRIDMVFKIIDDTTREMTLTLIGDHDALQNALDAKFPK